MGSRPVSVHGRKREGEATGGWLDPLTPNSIRRGDTLCRTIPAGGGGCASSPADAGGYCSAPSSCACAGLDARGSADGGDDHIESH